VGALLVVVVRGSSGLNCIDTNKCNVVVVVVVVVVVFDVAT
jgi:hypothetical protein